MDFVKLYEKKVKKREQQEDYVTELIAFICRISSDFKKFYLNTFLDLNLSNIESIRIETQVRSSNEKSTNNIPDFIIYEKNKVICLCEHKINSDINFKDNKNTQLDGYFSEYGKECKYFLIKPEFKILKHFFDRHKKIWNINSWQHLFILLKKKYIKSYFEYDDYAEFISKDKNIDYTLKLVYFLMELLDEFELYDFDLLDYQLQYIDIQGLLDKTIKSVKRFYIYKDILKELKGNKQGGSEIKDFIENARIYIKVNNRFDYYGFYGWADQFYLLRWKGTKYFPFALNEEKILRIKNKFNKEDTNLSSAKGFNNQYDKTQEHLDKFNIFFSKIISQIKFELEKQNILLNVGKILSDTEPERLSFEFKLNNIDMAFEVSDCSFLLYFNESNLTNNQMSKIKFKNSDEYDDWGYFDKNINDLQFIEDDINKIIKFYIDSILKFNSIKKD